MSLIAAPENFGIRRHTVPAYVPAVATDVTTSDCFVEEITLSNVSATAVRVTIQDRQGTPIPLIKDLELDGSTSSKAIAVLRFDGRYCPGGVNWSASAANAVVGYLRVR